MIVSGICLLVGPISVTVLVRVTKTVDVNGTPAYVVIVLVTVCVEKTVGARTGAACLLSRR